MSYLYILKHLDQPSFKIGKANDIWTRLKCIGGAASFDIANSHCIQFDSVDAAYRAERLLHRCFDGFLYGIDEANRYDGDTEHFKIEAWDRVIAFCQANLDLIGGALSAVPASSMVQNPEAQKSGLEDKRRQKGFYTEWIRADSRIADLELLLNIDQIGIYDIGPEDRVCLGTPDAEMRGVLNRVKLGGGFSLPGLFADFLEIVVDNEYVWIASIKSKSGVSQRLDSVIRDAANGLFACLEIKRLQLLSDFYRCLPHWDARHAAGFLKEAGYLASTSRGAQSQVNKTLNVLMGCPRLSPQEFSALRSFSETERRGVGHHQSHSKSVNHRLARALDVARVISRGIRF